MTVCKVELLSGMVEYVRNVVSTRSNKDNFMVEQKNGNVNVYSHKDIKYVSLKEGVE